ncbi:Hypothetical predicted protein [Mytilus galloprovincialis]|uniref:Reverse transcriptase domain-containing protein n=1 Tax=Mytilus galloprovincialis TaxID=29158 RepID=A0A8B6DUG9_MYTGA|nr:Hypothetical predicted protein [Mytilus galloprovincialis]
MHFQNLVSGNTHNENENQKESIQNVFEELDAPFTENELSYGIRQLKRDKTPGFDNILNEYLITGKAALTQVLCKLFNDILNTGNFPQMWVKSIMVPVFKKGDVECG